MLYAIDQVPIRIGERKSAFDAWLAYGFLVFLFAIPVFWDALIIFGHTASVSTLGVIFLSILPWPFFGYWFWKIFNSPNPYITIDGTGVCISGPNGTKNYLWEDIQVVNFIKIPIPRTGLYTRAISIKRKGQIMVGNESDQIDDIFDISIDNLRDLIVQGLEKWGSPLA